MSIKIPRYIWLVLAESGTRSRGEMLIVILG